jgi:GT2 family glycosyltransferase
MTRPLSVAAVVATSSQEREPLLRACVSSLLAGGRVPDELFVVVDQNPGLEAELARSLPAQVTVLHSGRPGLSGSRNAGATAASSDVVVFVDDDARAEPEWLSLLMQPFEASPEVLGAGGAVVPEWAMDSVWLPEELLWLVGCTYRGHREDAGPIRNPIGCNMAFRRRELLDVGSFVPEFGRRRNMYCDETELGLRVERVHGPGRIVYVPAARVHHHVPAARLAWKVLAGRCVREGVSKGRLHVLYRGAATRTERGYALGLLLRSAPRLLVGGIIARDPRLVRGGAAVLASLAITTAAFVAGAATARRPGILRFKGARRA